MKRLRYVMIGGFLGAGKTTTIARLAKHYTDQGLKVGIVTNDQAHGLVDTMSLRAQGFNVGEVTGACFCCKFNDLTDVIGQDKILGPEGPLGAMLAATEQPGEDLWGDAFSKLPEGERAPFQQMTFTLHDSQVEQVKTAVSIAAKMGAYDSPNENGNGNALARICETFTTDYGNG